MFTLYTMYAEYIVPKILFTALIVFLLHVELGYAVDDEPDPANYAFANYLGSGIYRSSGQNATVINIPFSYQLENSGGADFRVRLPVSVGFFDYEIPDLAEGDIPTSIDTLSFVPGIEFDYHLNDWLMVTPYFDLGGATSSHGDVNTAIYSSGVSLFYDLKTAKLAGSEFKAIWVNRLYYAGYYTLESHNQEEYASFQTGIDIKMPYHFKWLGRTIQPTTYFLTDWYFINLEFDSKNQQDVSLSSTYELGLTLLADKPVGYSFMSFDRLGIGYRFGKDFYAWRLLFDLPI